MPDAPADILLLRKMHPLVEGAFAGRHTVPVSYTHLTLPTILQV